MKGFPPQEPSLSSGPHWAVALMPHLGLCQQEQGSGRMKTDTENFGKGCGTRAQALLPAIPGSKDHHLPARKARRAGLPPQHPQPDLLSCLLPTTLNHLSHNGLSLEGLHSCKSTCCPADDQPEGRGCYQGGKCLAITCAIPTFTTVLLFPVRSHRLTLFPQNTELSEERIFSTMHTFTNAHIFTDIIEVEHKQYILTQRKSFKSYQENKLQCFLLVCLREIRNSYPKD